MKNTMTYCGYMASLEFDPDDNILVGRVLGVNPVVHAAALKAAAHTGQSLNRWAEQVLRQATHS